MSPLLRRLEALETAHSTVPAVHIVPLEMHKPSPARPPILRAVLAEGQMQQNDDEAEDAFKARVRVAARQAPCQAVVVLDAGDADL